MKSLSRWFWLLFLSLALTGCAGLGERGPVFQAEPTPLVFSSGSLPEGEYRPRAENVQVLLDTSASMAVNGHKNLQSAKNFVLSLGDTLPESYSGNVGLRLFGDDQDQARGTTVMSLETQTFDSDKFSEAVNEIQSASGENSLELALLEAGADLKDVGGMATLLIVSDGSWSWQDVPSAVKAVIDEKGESLCIYTVWVGDITGTEEVLQRVVDAGRCGAAINGKDLIESKDLSDFAQEVFLSPPPAESPSPEDDASKPNNDQATEFSEGFVYTVLFDFNEALIKEEMKPILGLANIAINADATGTYEVSGHACPIGTEDDNQKLSERRAESVKNWLVDKGISPERLNTVGYGETQPKVDNTTADERSLNRRVEIFIR